jgi:hypothetical protein
MVDFLSYVLWCQREREQGWLQSRGGGFRTLGPVWPEAGKKNSIAEKFPTKLSTVKHIEIRSVMRFNSDSKGLVVSYIRRAMALELGLKFAVSHGRSRVR